MTDKPNLTPEQRDDLLARLRAAKEPDRELDRRLAALVGHGNNLWPLPYTASVDTALALVERCLPGWKRSLFEKRGGGWIARVSSPHSDTYTSGEDERRPTASIAILIALISALGEEVQP